MNPLKWWQWYLLTIITDKYWKQNIINAVLVIREHKTDLTIFQYSDIFRINSITSVRFILCIYFRQSYYTIQLWLTEDMHRKSRRRTYIVDVTGEMWRILADVTGDGLLHDELREGREQRQSHQRAHRVMAGDAVRQWHPFAPIWGSKQPPEPTHSAAGDAVEMLHKIPKWALFKEPWDVMFYFSPNVHRNEMNFALGQGSTLYCAGDNLWLMRWILLWIMPLVQDQSLDLLISSPSRYHCVTDAPNKYP